MFRWDIASNNTAREHGLCVFPNHFTLEGRIEDADLALPHALCEGFARGDVVHVGSVVCLVRLERGVVEGLFGGDCVSWVREMFDWCLLAVLTRLSDSRS